jgi:hypothetical protein
MCVVVFYEVNGHIGEYECGVIYDSVSDLSKIHATNKPACVFAMPQVLFIFA